MRILYFSQFYPPESIAAAFRASDHAHIWADDGHEVTMFTGWPNYPTGSVFDGYDVKRLGEDRDGQVLILRSKSLFAANTSMVSRVVVGGSWFAYGLLNCFLARDFLRKRCDVALVTTGTVFAAMIGCLFARLSHAPFVVEFRDITWQQMIATGSSVGGWKVRLMKRLELGLCDRASAVVTLTEGFRDALSEAGIPDESIVVVPNGADIVNCHHAWSEPGTLRLGYFGTMGISQDVIFTLDLLDYLSLNGINISYSLIGEGAVRPDIEKALSSGSYPFAELRHSVPKDKLEPSYAAVDMTVVSLKKSDSFASTIPSKIFQSFARGVPVLFCGPEGEAAKLVRESGAGIVLTGEAKSDKELLQEFALDPFLSKRLSGMSQNAVSFMEAHYTRKRMAEKMLGVLNKAAGYQSHEEGSRSK